MTIITKLWDYLFAPAPVAGRQVNHRQLGVLIADGEGWWLGKRKIGGNVIEFSIEGTNGAVNQELSEYCLSILENFSVYYELALDLIASDLSIPLLEASKRFTPTSIFSITRHKNERLFYMGFTDAENKFALWRVQFENEIATHVGLDS